MSPILHQVGAIFLPVQDINKARDWYCDLLNLPADGDILHGHLYILPLEGVNVILDSKIYNGNNTFQAPAFHFNTKDIEAAYAYMKAKQINLTSDIENGHWFNFKDPDGNHLMICQC
mgnify:FL=1